MKLGDPHPPHLYRWATAAEKAALFKEVADERSINQLKLRQRFAQGASLRRPRQLRFDRPTILLEKPLTPRALFHEGLLKDAQGVFWIVKKPAPGRSEVPRHERLAYLLSQRRANYAEIRLLQAEEGAGLTGLDGREVCYLVRAACASNLDPATLPQKEAAAAYAAILVAHIWMRKWNSHLDALGFAGEVPVSINHNAINPSSSFLQTDPGREAFGITFLAFKVLPLAQRLSPRYGIDRQAAERLKDRLAQQRYGEASEALKEMLQLLGLGAGLIAAERLQVAHLHKSILAFKAARNLREAAWQAGFRGADLEKTAAHLMQSQETLAGDVGRVWQRLSGEHSRLGELDRTRAATLT